MDRRDNSMAWWAAMLLLFTLLILIILARQGDVTAIVILAVIGVLVFLILGGGFALLVMSRMNEMEERRFRANVKENMALMDMQQRSMAHQLGAQARVNYDLIRQNQLLARPAEPDFGLDLDALFDDAPALEFRER